jgi:DNA invertase Pin-like site-specific DNA recombinase
MAERVRALGWQEVEIINNALGSSAGLAAAQREGFERVLSSVALGEVGSVGSREVSRLSRTDKDWCRLLEVCQIFGTHSAGSGTTALSPLVCGCPQEAATVWLG